MTQPGLCWGKAVHSAAAAAQAAAEGFDCLAAGFATLKQVNYQGMITLTESADKETLQKYRQLLE